MTAKLKPKAAPTPKPQPKVRPRPVTPMWGLYAVCVEIEKTLALTRAEVDQLRMLVEAQNSTVHALDRHLVRLIHEKETLLKTHPDYRVRIGTPEAP